MSVVTLEHKTAIDFALLCDGCGAEMVGAAGNGTHNGNPFVYVPPCAACAAQKYDEGYSDGREAAGGEGA